MEHWSARGDSPYVRRPGSEPSSSPWWLWVLMVVLLGAGAGYYFWTRQVDEPRSAAPLAASEPAPADAPQPEQAPMVRYPVPEAQKPPAKALPTLENSDPMARQSAVEARGTPSQLSRRIVATVDNLPRETARTRVMPLEPVPGRFTPGPANAARYAPYVRVLESLDARALVQRYIESYPLFQRAYAELGYPQGNFNDRLVEAIEDLLAASDLKAPPELAQPKVLYEYADPELQARSAGQKIMMRMGAQNAARVKAKLREIRLELVQR